MAGSWLYYMTVVVGVTMVVCDVVKYEGYTVHQATPTSYEHLQELLNHLTNLPIDIWHMPHGINDTVDIMVGPDERQNLLNSFNNLRMPSKQVVDNVERLFQKERHQVHHVSRRATPSPSSYINNFHTYAQIIDFIYSVKKAATNTNVDIFSIGNSTQYRYMAMVKIHSGINDPNKPAILIDGGIHAREWIAPAVVVNFIYQLSMNPNNDPQISQMVSDFDWYLLPMVNPDGYHHSHVSERTWRKTMNVNHFSQCLGTDANRNFGYHWDPHTGGSTNPCDLVYSGSQAFSIPESTHLASFMRQNGHKIKAYLTYHSYGQYFLYPFGYSRHAVASDWQDLQSLARTAVNAMTRSYTIGASGKDLYPAAGGSDDYAKGACGVKYSYTVELPPSDGVGYTGFIMDPRNIHSVASDSLNGLKALALELARRENI